LTLPNTAFAKSHGASFFPASYVKFLESGGARVVPIPYDLPADDLAALLRKLNGALFTGGAAAFFGPAPAHAPTAYALTAQRIYAEVEAAAAAGETWPLWGTCLGHELVGVLAAGLDYATSPLSSGFDSENLTAAVAWAPSAAASRLWGPVPDVRAAFAGLIAYNAHTSGFTPADFAGDARLSAAFSSLGTSVDRAGRAFVASMEGKSLPIYTTQWHPEKAMYEWNGAAQYNDINHSTLAVSASSHPAAFFVDQARANNRSFASADEENDALIYNFAPVFAPKVGLSNLYEQIYFFPGQ
jgi:gamma-glutamyl hydrolase